MSHPLSPHFTLAELLQSETAARRRIDNSPSQAIVDNLTFLAGRLEVIRELLGNLPIIITSGYRCSALNVAVGGSKTSAHMSGLAADFICPAYGSPLDICRRLAERAGQLAFDQVIQEGSWVHVGFAQAGREPRRQVLTAQFSDGGASYSPGLGG